MYSAIPRFVSRIWDPAKLKKPGAVLSKNSIKGLISLFQTFRFILKHPLNRDRKIAALKNWLFWQIRSRFSSGSIICDFVNSSRLAVKPGMHGATQNIYCGLQDFEEMSFLLHFLSNGDLFVDVGANVGTYTVLAAAAVGARVIAFEPIPSSFETLIENIELNAVKNRVIPKRIGVADQPGIAFFTDCLDTQNHIVRNPDHSESTRQCIVDNLDGVLGDNIPRLIKIDVEGYEFAVIEGAAKLLQDKTLEAIIIELNGCGLKYGYEDSVVFNRLRSFGFEGIRYHPFKRGINPLNGPNLLSSNTILVRSLEAVELKCRNSPRFKVLNTEI